jgi:squalene-associated FAD-dependent desaturase
VGGGLAGLAAAVALADSGCHLTLFEARRRPGGRAASFEDPIAGGLIDACQHVAMGCCTNFLDLCRVTGIAAALRRDRTLWFISPDGSRVACSPSRRLPAPLHMAPLLFHMRHFTLGERLRLGLGMLQLARLRPPTVKMDATAATWLESIGQPRRVIEYFWRPVLESALGESIDLVSVEAARKVAVDGFLAHREAADVYVPLEPLGELFGERLAAWLMRRGVVIKSGTIVTEVERLADGRVRAIRCGTVEHACDALIMAVPWRQAGRLVPDLVPTADDALMGSPITAVHLWFDRPVVDLPHAVFLGFTSQWVFRGDGSEAAGRGYCQVVISASRGLLDGDRGRVLDTVLGEIRRTFPAATAARLLEAKVVTDPTAVLSVRPGVDAVRPPTTTVAENIFLAGDWTSTGWPSTMEGAVRSGRAAAEAMGRHLGRPVAGLVPDLPKGWLVRALV